jgi:hypothetical protein
MTFSSSCVRHACACIAPSTFEVHRISTIGHYFAVRRAFSRLQRAVNFSQPNMAA